MKAIATMTVGALLLIGAAATFIEAARHRPSQHLQDSGSFFSSVVHTGWSTTTYDLARIGAWAAVIVGALLVAIGLISYATRGRSSNG